MRLLVLGGTRSGKSAHAESVAAATGTGVVYVATARRDPDDAEMASRIAAHRDRRPTDWVTEETDEITRVLAEYPDSTILVDDLGGWLTRRMDATLGWTDGGAAVAEETDALVDGIAAHPGPVILVSPEVGLGVVPDTLSGRVFADVIGSLNRRLARVCDAAVLVVAGRVLPLDDARAAADARPRAGVSGPAAAATPVSAATTAGATAGESVPPATPADVPTDFPGLADVAHYEDPVSFPPVHPPSHSVAEEARARQLTLTKPAGSLGRLEELGVWIASCQGTCPPRPLERARVVVFAGDHGVAEHGVSAFPREVTLQMADNIVGGGAAVSVLARAAGASVRVADMAMASERPGGLDDHKIRRSSGAIDREDALTPEEARAAIAAGRRIADEEVDSGADLLIAGDLGIGNTTPATVLTCLVTGHEPVELVGRGTGVDDEGWMRKTAAIRDAMFRASGDLRDPVAMLRKVGGADLAAMAGFLAQAAVRRTPCLLDGSVVTSAALMAEALAPGSRQWWTAGHRSAEPAHSAALTYLSLEPVLDHAMRLGEGSGAVAALPVVHNAVAILTEMATFADAGVSDKG
ncbi:nicotinate-nucleotide--dimethylbenzimidazole phosphoribosyltransferase [Dietzia sp. CH92]|uniref:nicotinate-nucleotide--dimethylbenzimidazole phosphoribosyltransferase n=1 Tax=Dietzia sp. CH92 TaxID=3051823 RepID=UPI0028D6F218|nr:nicotinate-nucleotide--dimethylbenzimidazole phosphoribosyltransferase [Dietzia sp. CH92]